MYTLRSQFPTNLPTHFTRYCFVCGSDSVSPLEKDGKRIYQCATNQCISERFLAWDPKMRQYFNDAQELIHESVGVVVQREDGAILFFLRTKFPFEWTVPAGHLETNEDPKHAVLRELKEETGIAATEAELIYTGELRGDSCVGGADIHRWHLYRVRVLQDVSITIEREEGSEHTWTHLDQLPKPATFPTVFLLSNPQVVERLRLQESK